MWCLPGRKAGSAAAAAAAAEKPTPLPMRAIAMVIFVQFSEAFQITVLFPFVPFMVASFPEVSEDNVGLYAGLVAAAFPFGQFCSSVLWGRVADRLGAKKVVLFSLVLTCICTVAFGFSTGLLMAVLLRLAAGLCNGNVGVVKSYLGKVTDVTNQGHAMALLSAAWSLGSIIAPALGGFLADPAEKYPDVVQPGSVLDTWPYLLPCLVAASCLVISILLVIFFMREAEEVLREIAERRERLAQSDDDDAASDGRTGWRARLRRWLGARKASLQRRRSVRRLSKDSYGRVATVNDSDDDDDNDDNGAGAAGAAGAATDSTGARPAASGTVAVTEAGPEDADAATTETFELADVPLKDDAHSGPIDRAAMLARMGSSITSLNPDGSVTLEPLHYRPPRLRTLLFATSMYGLVALFFSFVDDVFPVYCRDTFANGGLEFSTNDIGIALSFLGGFAIFYNVFVYPFLARRHGLMKLYRFSLVLGVPMCLIYPATNLLGVQFGRPAIWAALLLNLVLRAVVGLHMFTAVMVYINNSVPRERMGYANGIGQTFAAGVRAVGPTMAGVLWSTISPLDFPGSHWIVFIVAAAMLILQYGLSFKYPASIQKPFVKVPIDDPEGGGSIEMSLASSHKPGPASPASTAASSPGSSSPPEMAAEPVLHGALGALGALGGSGRHDEGGLDDDTTPLRAQ